MKDEIKDLLQYLKNVYESEETSTWLNKLQIKDLLDYITNLQEKYDKALELLIDYNMPCEMDDFMNVFSDFCSRNCSVDEEQFKSCWDLFIEWKCKNTTKIGGE